MNSKSDEVRLGDNTTGSDDNEFMNNIANDLKTLVKYRET